jgi:hypothetical protein
LALLAVLPGEAHVGAVGAFAEVGRVDEEALLLPAEGEGGPFDGSVGESFEGGAQLAFDRVDAADEVDVDLLAAQRGDHVG